MLTCYQDCFVSAVLIFLLTDITNNTTTATNFLYKLIIMIEKLFIKNYLIIKEAEIDFSKGLNILTGETGAGKSIILDALSMLLGERADYSIIKKDQDKLIIEGHFDFSFNKNIVSVVQEILPEDDFSNGVIIIRRELLKKGVSRNFINDNPVNISDMKKLGNSIVDIHSQNEHQSLLNKETHLGILDSFAANKDLLSGYLSILNELKSLIQNFQELSQKKDDIISKKTFLDFELKEINNLNLSYEEDTNLETDLNKLENVEDISTSLENSVNLLFENESNALSTVSLAIKELKKIVHFDKNIEKIIEDLESSYILIKESSESLINYRTELNFSSDRTDQIRERLSSINHLKRKYGMTVDELIRRSEKLSEELKLAENFDFETDKLLNKISLKREEVYKLAKNLSLIRIKRSKELEKGINLLFKEVGLESAEFKTEFRNIPGKEDDLLSFKSGKEFIKINEKGLNDIEFLIKINKGTDFSPLRKSASGGEISRIMLAIKNVISEKDEIPILVFDEIDAGISGRIAQKVGKILNLLSKSHQIICITHLPQIAAMSERHFRVSKNELNGYNFAEIKSLSEKEKVEEVAKLISGEKVTNASIQSALELIAKH